MSSIVVTVDPLDLVSLFSVAAITRGHGRARSGQYQCNGLCASSGSPAANDPPEDGVTAAATLPRDGTRPPRLDPRGGAAPCSAAGRKRHTTGVARHCRRVGRAVHALRVRQRAWSSATSPTSSIAARACTHNSAAPDWWRRVGSGHRERGQWSRRSSSLTCTPTTSWISSTSSRGAGRTRRSMSTARGRRGRRSRRMTTRCTPCASRTIPAPGVKGVLDHFNRAFGMNINARIIGERRSDLHRSDRSCTRSG